MCAFANVTSHRAFTHLSVFQPLRTEKMFLSAVALVDPISCGRLDADSLPHQTLMELLVGDFDDTECFRDEDGGFKDIRTWYGVVVNTDGLVCSIEWESAEQIDIFGEGNIPCGLVSPGGCINMHWIPSSVTAFTACELNLSGSMDTRAFSHHLVSLSVGDNRFHANPTKGHLSVVGWTSTPVWGKPRTFLNPSSCFCHGADPIDGHRKVVGQDQYPALGEVRETAKLLPRGESPWWRDEGRHLLILCCFNPRDEISPHA